MKRKFVIRNASNWSDTSVISIADLSELLNLIEKYDEPIIVRKNHYLEEYKKDREQFKKKYIRSLVEKVQEWEEQEANYEIIIYDDYIE